MLPNPTLDLDRDIYSVSRLASEVRAVLDGSFPLLWVRGEISNLAQPASGHLYFTLKDEGAQIRCAMFRAKRLLIGFRPENGGQVLARARPTLYEPRGDFQLVVEHMEPGGEGALRLELERLKRRLAAEGLFAESSKRPLPQFPQQVGLVTSPSGAAVHDLLTVLGRRAPGLRVLIYPAQVQGQGAPESLVSAIALAGQRLECDVLILARGGGSFEDLAAFDDESVVRAIRACPIPVVTGVGHEVDVTLADLAADRRAATPSAAAELVAPSAEQMAQQIAGLAARLSVLETRILQSRQQLLESATRHLELLHPRARLERSAQRLDDLERRLADGVLVRLERLDGRLEPLRSALWAISPLRRAERAASRLEGLHQRLVWSERLALEQAAERLATAVAGLEGRSPLGTLARGYAIVSRDSDGSILRDPADAPPGTAIRARLFQGTLRALVSTEEPEPGNATPKRVRKRAS